jgi:hypothetical protein
MEEMYRVLKFRGYAAIVVPLTAATTFEDPSIKSSRERKKYFGQKDHVRRYGPDVMDRLMRPGFCVTNYVAAQMLDDFELHYFGVYGKDNIFICEK